MHYNFEFLRDRRYDSKDLGMSDRLSSNKNRNWNYNTGYMDCTQKKICWIIFTRRLLYLGRVSS